VGLTYEMFEFDGAVIAFKGTVVSLEILLVSVILFLIEDLSKHP
jgi:hypothetical protein